MKLSKIGVFSNDSKRDKTSFRQAKRDVTQTTDSVNS